MRLALHDIQLGQTAVEYREIGGTYVERHPKVSCSVPIFDELQIQQ